MKVKCSNPLCGKYFTMPTLIQGPPGIHFKVENSKVKCPYCRKFHLIENGEYVTNEEGTYTLKKKLDEAGLDKGVLEKLLTISIAARDESITIEEFAEELETLGLSHILPSTINDRKAFVLFILSLITTLNILLSTSIDKASRSIIEMKEKSKIENVQNVKVKKARYPKQTKEKYSKSLKEYLKSIKN